MRESQRHTVPAFFLKCAVLQSCTIKPYVLATFTTIRICAVLQLLAPARSPNVSFTTHGITDYYKTLTLPRMTKM